MLIEIRRWVKRIRSDDGGWKELEARTATASRSLPILARAVYRRERLRFFQKTRDADKGGRQGSGGRASERASEIAKKKGISGRRGILKAIRRYTSLCSRWHAGFLCVAIERIPQETASFCSGLRYQYAPPIHINRSSFAKSNNKISILICGII